MLKAIRKSVFEIDVFKVYNPKCFSVKLDELAYEV